MHYLFLTKSQALNAGITCLAYLCLLIFSVNSHAKEDNFSKQRAALDKQYQAFTEQFYQDYLNSNKQPAKQSMQELKSATQSADTDVHKVAIIINNLTLIQDNFDNRDSYHYITTLLDNNALSYALTIIASIEEYADITTITHSHYLLALYYFQRQQWTTTLKYLQEDGLNLSKEVYAHRVFIKGVTLQKLTKHRDAIASFEKIPAESQYYLPAQFNIALANLRQGWWSQAHQIIEKLQKNPAIKGHNQALDRIYITLAYSLLKKGYFRTSKEYFQKVALNSKYANQALLGIALTSVQQDDYLGGLSASRILKNKTEDELPVDEAHLLMPYFYERSQQWMTASIGYSEASNHYQSKLAKIKQLQQQSNNWQKVNIGMDKPVSFDVQGITVNLSEFYPRNYFVQAQQLSAYQQGVDQLNNKKLQSSYAQLQQSYRALTNKMIQTQLQNKYRDISSYLDQTRYGLVRLYDNNMAQK